MQGRVPVQSPPMWRTSAEQQCCDFSAAAVDPGGFFPSVRPASEPPFSAHVRKSAQERPVRVEQLALNRPVRVEQLATIRPIDLVIRITQSSYEPRSAQAIR